MKLQDSKKVDLFLNIIYYFKFLQIKNQSFYSLEQQKLRENIQQYEHKKNENEMVKNEMDFLDDSDVVYKLIGPILVKQEIDEAKMTVEKRLEFITKEM